MSVPAYRSQEWLFDVAAGRYEVDLAVSGMEAHSVEPLLAEMTTKAGYDVDRGAGKLREAVAALYRVRPGERADHARRAGSALPALRGAARTRRRGRRPQPRLAADPRPARPVRRDHEDRRLRPDQRRRGRRAHGPRPRSAGALAWSCSTARTTRPG
ncbi:hypothetical protein FXN61_12395 [Lentzea sp. PSKA42]|uniref:Uncharacterized protein n=1 Tax=Lentzea indica TaxID=2604800 RepID=A0ABX1FG34_9PSEU|nr:hypothetical protein [Lentzea indica]NKE57592.1 hypothetical protein [Lentzea indica]